MSKRTLKDSQAHIGIRVPGALKTKLAHIAKKEHRTLSGQALLFLRSSVEQWDATNSEVSAK